VEKEANENMFLSDETCAIIASNELTSLKEAKELIDWLE